MACKIPSHFRQEEFQQATILYAQEAKTFQAVTGSVTLRKLSLLTATHDTSLLFKEDRG
jgi:hypothetical protein